LRAAARVDDGAQGSRCVFSPGSACSARVARAAATRPARLPPASPSLAGPFLEPVDWQTHGLKDYPKVIKHPMDLGTVATRLKMREYKHPKVRARAQARGQRCAQRRIARRGKRARLGGAGD